MTKQEILLLILALALGALFAYVDSRPNWDDTGVEVGAILISSGALGFVGWKRPWLWALAVGIWIPLVSILRSQNIGATLALVVAFAGAYAGMAIRKGVRAMS